MQAKPWTPRIIILIAFILLACPCVHADRYFTVSHSIVNNRVCFSRFWEKGGTEEKTAATIRPDSPAEFSLGFCHENVSVVSLSVAFGPLVTEEPGSFETCDYNVETFNPSNQTSYAEPAARGTATYTDIYPNSDGTSKAYMGTYTTVSLLMNSNVSSLPTPYRIADFEASVSAYAAPGRYSGYVRLIHTYD